jgi:hypothetical protein
MKKGLKRDSHHLMAEKNSQLKDVERVTWEKKGGPRENVRG